MKITKEWSMPNKHTFDIKPIKKLIHRYIDNMKDSLADPVIIDPFANKNRIANITNDLDKDYDTDYNMDATDFLCLFDKESIDIVLYDPPYSSRQVVESYSRLGYSVNMQTTQSSYWRKHKEQIGKIVRPGGIVITCGWNSGGMGKKYGFKAIEHMLVAHGGWHNDTIITVEVKEL